MDDHPVLHSAGSCCAPANIGRNGAGPITIAARGDHRIEQARIPAQGFIMGDSFGDGNPGDGETPLHTVTMSVFSIDATTVTNADYARFVDSSGYLTEAQRVGSSAVFHLAVPIGSPHVIGTYHGTPWWLAVAGADWQHPYGPNSGIADLADHPAVHITWNDATAYCQWAGRRLPTEAEWEAASRGGLDGARFPWGDDWSDEPARANIWHGEFPRINTLDDGHLFTAPVRTYQPNSYGLWQTVGNVWEWCSDWFDPDYYIKSPDNSPAGPPAGDQRVLRGGSFLCHDSYCNRYRNSARSSNTPDSSMLNSGFRTVAR